MPPSCEGATRSTVGAALGLGPDPVGRGQSGGGGGGLGAALGVALGAALRAALGLGARCALLSRAVQ